MVLAETLISIRVDFFHYMKVLFAGKTHSLDSYDQFSILLCSREDIRMKYKFHEKSDCLRRVCLLFKPSALRDGESPLPVRKEHIPGC